MAVRFNSRPRGVWGGCHESSPEDISGGYLAHVHGAVSIEPSAGCPDAAWRTEYQGTIASRALIRVRHGSFEMKTIRNITSVGLLLTALSTTLPARADVIAWGLNNAGQCDIPTPPAGAEWVAIAAGDESTLLLASDGSIAGVGWCGAGQCSAPALPPGKRYVAIAAGNACGAALRNDGELFVFGSNEWGQHDVPPLEPGLTYVEVAVGWDHIAARRSDGTVVVWGRGTYGEHNVPALPSGVTYTQISSGVYFSAALRSDGQISVWG